MFVMHYHQLSIAGTYFQEDHPGNAKVQSWIRAFRERNNLSASDVWLHVLRYYLDTPHAEIIKHGNEAETSMVDSAIQNSDSNALRALALRNQEVDPDLKYWESMAYSSQMGGYFLNIWEAAPDEEFIISSNSFGLYEGRMEPWGPLHRFYVISPRIVLVLCHILLKPAHLRPFGISLNPRHLALSMVLDVPHRPANITYSKSGTMSDQDWFELTISTLSSNQTHTINSIILANVSDQAMVTFKSENAMLRTIDAFANNHCFSNQSKYRSLVMHLQEKLGIQSSPSPERQESSSHHLQKHGRSGMDVIERAEMVGPEQLGWDINVCS